MLAKIDSRVASLPPFNHFANNAILVLRRG
jgi:hypothetical protein